MEDNLQDSRCGHYKNIRVIKGGEVGAVTPDGRRPERRWLLGRGGAAVQTIPAGGGVALCSVTSAKKHQTV